MSPEKREEAPLLSHLLSSSYKNDFGLRRLFQQSGFLRQGLTNMAVANLELTV